MTTTYKALTSLSILLATGVVDLACGGEAGDVEDGSTGQVVQHLSTPAASHRASPFENTGNGPNALPPQAAEAPGHVDGGPGNVLPPPAQDAPGQVDGGPGHTLPQPAIDHANVINHPNLPGPFQDALTCDGPSSQPCGNCGTQTRTCERGTWSAWSVCSGEGVCSPSTTQACGANGRQTCSNSCQWDACTCVGSATQACTCWGGTGVQTRTCDAGTWSTYGACGGGTCVTPPVYRDISAGQGTYTGLDPSVVVDTANKKLLTVTSNYTNSDGIHFQGGLFRCELDGTGCTFRDFHGAAEYWQPNALVDPFNGKLLIPSMNHKNTWPGGGVGLFRCDLDGSSCTHTDITTAQTSSGLSAEIDPVGRKLLAITDSSVLFRCNLDGTACTQTDVSFGLYTQDPKIVVDVRSSKLLIVFPSKGPKTAPYSPSSPDYGKPVLVRCELDGSACVLKDLAQGFSTSPMFFPSAFIDDANAKLIVAAETTLLRCALDGTACVRTDTSFGGSPNKVTSGAVLDTAHDKIVLLMGSDLVRCNRDATGCKLYSMYPDYRLSYPSVALTLAGTLASVGTDYSNNSARVGLALITTW